MDIIWFLVIGAVVGWLAGILMKGRGFGLLGNIIVGVVGGFLGGWLAKILKIYTYGSVGSFLVALGGAVVLLFLVGLFKK